MNCPRCDRPTLLQHGESVCLAHGTVSVPQPVPLPDDPPSDERHGRRWSAQERAWVLAHKDRLSAAAMAEHLHRSTHAVYQLLSKMGRRKRRHRSQATQVAPLATRRRRHYEHLQDAVRPGTVAGTARASGLTRAALDSALRRRGVKVTDDGCMSIREVARVYRVKRERVRRLVDLGVLVGERSGRYVRLDPGSVERAGPYLKPLPPGRPPRGGVPL